uniref:NADH-ubiquinone oxidoreductase chain 2 n=1 Tax=Idioscopus nitidulus TaxID=1561089 RepID=A0A0U2F0M2_9HEMI|nr:NADH dehydrogenase subunit 2 [Idioscopus nitidulus]AKU47317.1 NADH dehydrogenase subunit 2 [Idioscopus nitidulus]
MKMNSSIILFYSVMLLGVMLSLSSNNWVMIWLGMELSLMSFVPLINNSLMISSESAMKYFIVQSVSSSMFILGMVMMLTKPYFNYEMIIVLSMMMKMGAAPFHTWLLSMIEGLDYAALFILFTFMKIVPMIIIMDMNMSSSLFIMTSLIVGSMFGLTQNSVRKILSYSSIFNMGFMIYSLSNMSLWFLYFSLYSINLLFFTLVLNYNNINYLNQLVLNCYGEKSKLCIWTLMLSSGGMPPMMGFWGKLVIIELSINNSDWLISLIMIFTSLMTMFYYNRLCFISMCISSMMMKWKMSYLSWMNMNIMIINFIAMPFVIISKYLN